MMATTIREQTAIPARSWFLWAWNEDTESTTSHIVAERPYEGDSTMRDGGQAGYPHGFYYEHTACGRTTEGLGLAFQLTEKEYCRRCLAWAERHFR